METKSVRVDTPKMDSKIQEMSLKGFNLISTTVIPATGSIPDGHGGDYGDNEKVLLIFQK